MMEVAPMSLRMTHNVDGCEIIAKCPVDDWIDKGALYFSARGWCRLAMNVANNDTVKFYKVMDVAFKKDNALPEDTIVSDGTEVFAHSASRSGPSGTVADVAVR